MFRFEDVTTLLLDLCFYFIFLRTVTQRKLMLMHSALDNLENGEGHEHAVHLVELVPRRSDLPYRYVPNMFSLKEKKLHLVAANFLLPNALSTGKPTTHQGTSAYVWKDKWKKPTIPFLHSFKY